VDRCALFVDAGYMLPDGAMAVHGTRRRESVSWDYEGLLQLLGNLARDRTGLRCCVATGTRPPSRAGAPPSMTLWLTCQASSCAWPS